MTKPYLTILSTIRAHYSGEEVQGPCVDEAVGLEALPGGSGGLLPIREAALGSLGAGDPRRLLELPEDKPPRWSRLVELESGRSDLSYLVGYYRFLEKMGLVGLR